MPSESLLYPGFFQVYPHVYLHRCPVCSRENVLILGDRDWQAFIAVCEGCGFEGRFPARSKAAARARRWITYEMRSLRFKPVDDEPEPGLSRAEYGAEVGGSSGGG